MSVNNSKAKRILVLAMSALGVLAVLMILSLVMFPKYNAADTDDTQRAARAILAEPTNTLDVIIVGDSVPKSAFSPLHMYNEYGFTSYTCATFSQRPHIGLSYLRIALENQHPSVVLIETNVFYNNKYTISNGVMQLIEDALPVFQFHDRWKNLTLEDIMGTESEWTPDPAKGYYFNASTKGANSDDWMAETQDMNKPMFMSECYLRAMVAYCRYKGVTPVLISAPSTINMNDAKHNALQALADDMNIDYIDLNEGDTKVDVHWESESRDGGDHLNYAGAIRTSEKLGLILKERFQLPDHRNDVAYQDWANQYQSFVEEHPFPSS